MGLCHAHSGVQESEVWAAVAIQICNRFMDPLMKSGLFPATALMIVSWRSKSHHIFHGQGDPGQGMGFEYGNGKEKAVRSDIWQVELWPAFALRQAVLLIGDLIEVDQLNPCLAGHCSISQLGKATVGIVIQGPASLPNDNGVLQALLKIGNDAPNELDRCCNGRAQGLDQVGLDQDGFTRRDIVH